MHSSLKAALLITLASFVLPGCSHTSLISLTPDPVTGKTVRKVYSKYYDAGVWLIPGHLGMSVAVDQLNEYEGQVTVYAWNRDTEKRVLKIQSISRTDIQKNELIALPGERTGLEVGRIKVTNYATFISLEVAYTVDGAAGETSLRVERRTRDELKQYFGPNGIPPYPWFHDQAAKSEE